MRLEAIAPKVVESWINTQIGGWFGYYFLSNGLWTVLLGAVFLFESTRKNGSGSGRSSRSQQEHHEAGRRHAQRSFRLLRTRRAHTMLSIYDFLASIFIYAIHASRKKRTISGNCCCYDGVNCLDSKPFSNNLDCARWLICSSTSSAINYFLKHRFTTLLSLRCCSFICLRFFILWNYTPWMLLLLVRASQPWTRAQKRTYNSFLKAFTMIGWNF